MVLSGATFREPLRNCQNKAGYGELVHIPGSLFSNVRLTVGDGRPVPAGGRQFSGRRRPGRMPMALFEMAKMMNPQAGSLVAMGILIKDGDDYVMAAEYAKGMLNVNGPPMPIPMPGM